MQTFELTNQDDYIIHRVKLGNGQYDVSLMDSCINNLLDKQYQRNSYISLGQINEINDLLCTLSEEQCRIVNAYSEVKHYIIKNLDEVKELIANIDDYQILEEYSLEEVGRLITKKVPEYEITNKMEQFINYAKLAEQYLWDSNIKEDFCSYGLLVNTRNMLDNDLIKEKITEDKVLKIVVVNKKEFENSPFYRRTTICLPTDKDRLKEKLKNIGLEYENLSSEDTHVTNCKLVKTKNEILADRFDFMIERTLDNLVKRYNSKTPLRDFEELCKEVEKFDIINMSKFLSIVQAKADEIKTFHDLVDYAKNIKMYEVIPNVKNYDEMGRYLVNETGHFDDISLLEDYIDYHKLAKDYTQKGYTYDGYFTDFGYLIEKEKFEMVNKKENEEEEEME